MFKKNSNFAALAGLAKQNCFCICLEVFNLKKPHCVTLGKYFAILNQIS